jgi:D-glycero-D-manno-heptose 1,7-bisphosphate phosphatase
MNMWLSQYGLRQENFSTDSNFLVWECETRNRNPRFLLISDRDSTLIHDIGYVHKTNDLSIFEEAFTALRKVNDAGGSVVIITNQGGIGLEIFTIEDFANFNSKMIDEFRNHGIKIDFVLACPHHPNAPNISNSNCHCRKPKTKMFEYVLTKYEIAESKIAVFGDSESDIQAAERMNFPAYKINDKSDLVKYTDLWLSEV